MAKLFISYSRDDKPTVEDMVTDLEAVDHRVWIDSELVGGQSWWDRILQEIQRCDYFLIAMSQSFLKSEACDSELRYASALGKTIIPVKIANNFDETLLPSHLGRLQITNFDGGSKNGTLALIRAIDTAPESPSLPSDLPEAPSIPVSYLAELIEHINSSDTLDYDQQASLLFKLRNHFQSTGEIDGVLQAINQFDNRRDLLSSIGKELAKLESEVKQKKQPTPDPQPIHGQHNQTTNFKPKQSEEDKDKADGTTYAISGVSLLIPIVGFVMFFVWKKGRPTSSKWALWAAIAGVILYLLFSGGMESDPYYY